MVKLVDKQNIFNHGILSSKLHSRDDLKQYNGGVYDSVNFVCSRYGPMEKRVGTQYIWDLGNPGEKVFFLPFVFSVKQSVLLEFLEYQIRFYTFDGASFGPIADPGSWYNFTSNTWIYTTSYTVAVDDTVYSDSSRVTSAGTISAVTTGTTPTITVDDVVYTKAAKHYAIPTPFEEDQLDDISYVQSLDVLYIAFADRITPPYTLSRYANNNWKLEQFVTEDGPYLDTNYSVSKKMTITDLSESTSTVTLSNFTLGSADVGRWIRICTPRYNDNTYVYDEKWSYGKIATVANDGSSVTVDWSYRNFVDDGGTWKNGSTNIYTKSVKPEVGDKVYKEDTYATEAGTISAKTETTITVSDVTYTLSCWMIDATSRWRLGAWHAGTGNSDYRVTYPTKVSIHQQRLTWAGMTDKPWIWTSNSFAYKNYAPSDYEGTIADSNSIYLDISTDKVSDIFWMKSLKYLMIGTELGELRVYSSGTAITPSDVVSNRESSYGSFNAEPVVNDDNIVFIQRLQRTLRALSYDDNKLAYVGPELTILAENLTTGGIKKIVFQKEPNNTYWCLKEDGSLLSLTYDASQDVTGWSRSELAGDAKVIDLAVLPSTGYQQDMVLMAVEREVDGGTVRYLELLSKNFIPDVAHKDACFLDCAVHVTSTTAFNIVSGLDYLEGEEVTVMDEGSYLGKYTVEDGEITLDDDCKDVMIGLPYEAYFETLERDYQDKQISTKMSKLRIYKLRMYLHRTLGMSLYRLERGTVTRLITFDPTSNMDTTTELITGKVTIDVPSAWDCDYRLRVTSDVGMPCTVTGIIIGLELNEL